MTISVENTRERTSSINPPVFFTSAFSLIALLTFSVLSPEKSNQFFMTIQGWVLGSFSWFYILSVTLMFGFAVWLSFSRFGDLRLGADDERPTYSRASWYAMLFSAGMGIGLVFYGVAEPMHHYISPPIGEGLTPLARSHALSLTYHHWGLHAWSVYAVIGLSIAFFTYRRGLPLALRSCFYPIFGERIHGWIGHSIDILAVFGTLFGLATSLGAGATSVSAGLNRLFETPDTTGTQLIIICVITLFATISLVIGVDKGIKRLSELNMILAACLLLFVFIVGPTTSMISSFVESVGFYFRDFVDRSFRIGHSDPIEEKWIQGWSVIYWGWWIAWAPFVGMFVARISRGRTLRDFVLSIMCVPVLITFFWFAVFGGAALSSGISGEMVSMIKGAESGAQADALGVYVMLEQLPFGKILSFLTAIVVTIFFVSSSDSASYVVDILTSGGDPEPPVWQRIFWATAEGATAGILLYIGGVEILSGLKAGVVSFGLPFCLLMLMLCWALLKALKEESPSSHLPQEDGDDSGDEVKDDAKPETPLVPNLDDASNPS